ncbi:MAG: ABC-F family ATP-binding cassette domain-containing protein [Agathobacter sp.]|nr:ABC-F family ATP-binding cassette domain-containing protein [Agathobacter sp.]
MLQIKNLTITHIKDARVLLQDLSFSLNAGDKAAIIGEEGNGKSTLLKLIYDENLVEGYVEYTGEIIKNHLRIGYLPQELSQKEKALTAYEFMCAGGKVSAEYSLFLDVDIAELSQISREIKLPLEMFYSEQRLEQMSGGEKIKLQLARIMVNKPDVLFLDEPSNDLDMDTVYWLEDFIKNTQIPILYISHDEVLLENTANKIIHLEQIKRKTESRSTVIKSNYKEYVTRRNSSLLHQEQVARKERSEYQKQQEKFRQIQQKVEHQQNAISRQDPHGGALLKKTMHRVKAYEARFEKEFQNMTDIPETEDAIFIKFGENASVPAGKVVVDCHLPELRVHQLQEDRCLAKNVNLFIRGSEKVCIIGRNGCGKTTFLRILAEELLKRKDIKASYMPQNYEELLDMTQTPVEFLSVTGDKDEISKIRTYLGSMKYTDDEMNHCIGDLSGGQKAKLLLLKMSMAGSNVLILDEPTRNFSPLSNPVIRQMLKSFKGTIISVSHDRKYIEEVADKVYELTESGLVIKKE